MSGNAALDGNADSAGDRFHATCTACDFARRVDGQDAVLRTADAHEAAHGADHFVEFYLLDLVETGPG